MKVVHFDQLSHQMLCKDVQEYFKKNKNIEVVSYVETFSNESKGFFNATLIHK